MKSFTTGEAARILNLPGSRIRAFVRSGFVSPARGRNKQWQFSFQDLLLLKATKELLDSRVPPRKLTRLLASLKRQLPPTEHLSRIKIFAEGQRVVVWDGKARWQPDSGQFLLNFDARSVARRINFENRAASRPPADAAYWFSLGVELESRSTDEAERAYRRAISLEPGMVEAHLNLGKLHQDRGERKQARAHYRAAIEHDPRNPQAHFTYGSLMEELKQPDDAVAAYRQAVKLDPAFAAAHHRLGLLLDALGKKTEAIAHLSAARKLYRGK